MSWDFYGPAYWYSDVPEKCQGNEIGDCPNHEKSLVDLGIMYDSHVVGGGGALLCEQCHLIYGSGQRENDRSPRYELQTDGKWLLTDGGSYFRKPDSQFIIEGKPINFMDELGNTRLHNAIESGDIDVAKQILDEVGININQRNNVGVTPLMLARDLGYGKLADLIKEKGGIE